MANVKTAISLPEDLFRLVQQYSKRNRIPRSQVFAQAVRMLLGAEDAAEVTRRLNKVYADPEVQREQSQWAQAASTSLGRKRERARW
jgi:metal-responsive CopG/Arc/MetJ family transcriptional regulator